MLIPLIRTLQRHFPHATITWIITRPAYDLVEGLEGVEFIVLKKPNHIKDYWSFFQLMKKRRFDVLLATQASFRANLLYPLIKAFRKIGYDQLRAKDGHGWFINESIAPGNDHTLEGFLKFSSALGIKTPLITWDIPIGEEEITWAQQKISTGRPILLVNPAASKPERSWPSDRYIHVIKEAKARWNVQVILTGGPAEFDKCCGQQISEATPVTNLIGKTKPKQLLALIKLSTAVLCPDTGPSHMAAAVGTPVVALHAVTSANVSGPYPFRYLAVDYYQQAVKTVLKKEPNQIAWGTHVHGEKTMELVPVSSVMKNLEKIFNDAG